MMPLVNNNIPSKHNLVPSHLRNCERLCVAEPRASSLEWFAQANWGLFIHYGLYSLLGKGEWAQFHQKIPLAEYERLFDQFTAKRFDAEFLTDLALEAGMSYLTLVTCHHEGFCLWDSPTESFNSMRSPAKRDLVRELAEACARKGLGFFTYYTFMLNWRHPYFLSRQVLDMARPDYPQPESRYLFRDMSDFGRYVDYMLGHVRELLTMFGPTAGMWLDIIMAYYALGDIVPVRRTYDLVRALAPHALLAFKQGATGEEDFATPESRFHSLEEAAGKRYGPEAAARAREAWQKNCHKHNEVCVPLQKSGGWGYNADAAHMTVDELLERLGHARANNCNLLANIGPLPDGSVHPDDVRALREAGERIRRCGWPMGRRTLAPEQLGHAAGA
jgi:alpha-L-fucosidase